MSTSVFDQELASVVSEVFGGASIDLALLHEVILRVAVPKAYIPHLLQEMRDELASVEHSRWSHWQRYLHAQCHHHEGSGGALIIPEELVRKWERQASTSFEDLSEKEQESDREQVDRYLPLIARGLTSTAQSISPESRPTRA